MLAKVLAGGFLLLELLGLAFVFGTGGSEVFADPLYDEHQLVSQCATYDADCGSVCLYANCERCDQCCRCWETCSRETCRERCRDHETCRTNSEGEESCSSHEH